MQASTHLSASPFLRNVVRILLVGGLILFLMSALQLASEALTNPTVTTDKDDYHPEELVTITAHGLDPNTTYDIPVIRPNGSIVFGDGSFLPGWDSARTDGDGNLTYLYQLDGILGTYDVRVYASPWSGIRALAPITSTTFMDATFDIDQCSNGPPSGGKLACTGSNWQNGNLNDGNSQYREGDSVPFRAKFSSASTVVPTTITIGYDSIEGGVHAYDYLTSWDRTETGDPCDGVSGCGGSPSTFPIPVDARVTAGPDGSLLATADNIVQSAGSFKLYGGTITGVSAYTQSNADPNTTGTNETSVTVTFLANTSTPVLAWGGHIATRFNWRPDPNAVTDTQGSPYHMRNAGGGGQQDKSIKASAVIFPAKITIIKDALPDPNNGQDFAFTTTGGLTPSGFTLDDDADPTHSTTQIYSGLESFTTYSVTEGAVTGWANTNIECSVVDANGGSQTPDVANRKLTIDLKEGEEVTCTYTNKKDAKLTIVKNASPKDGTDFAFTTTGTGLANFSLDDDSDNTLSNTKTFTISGDQFGQKTVTEGPAAGWVLTDLQCSEGSVSGAAATVTVDPGDDITCTYTNKKDATLTVTKDASPADGQDFTFATTGTGPTAFTSGFALDVDSDNTLPSTRTFTFSGTQFGPKTVSEAGLTGWVLTNLSCSEGTILGSVATITIDPGDAVTCTYTNRHDATLTITKDASPADGTDFAFTTTGTGMSNFSLDDDSNNTLSDSQTFTFGGTGFGAKTVTEASLAGWTMTNLSCSEGLIVGSTATITIDPGDAVTCTYTNKKNASVTITKDAKPDNAQDFSFTTSGTGLSNFSLDDDSNNTLSNSQTFTISGNQFGQKTITENGVTGWTNTDVDCSEGTTNGSTATLDVDPGDAITCTYTNEQDATLTVTKDAVPDDPQDFSFTTFGTGLANFALDDDSNNTLSNTKTFTFTGGEFGPKTVSEDGESGWTNTALECNKGIVLGSTVAVTVDPGDAITCTYTNAKDATVTITKDAQPNDAQDFTFQTSGAGLSGFSLDDDSNNTLSNTKTFTISGTDFGQKTITEDAQTGWALTGLSCSEGSTVGAAAVLDVDPGDAITCTYTNKKDAKVTITKDAQPNDGQDFTFSTTGGLSGSNFSLDDDSDNTLSDSKTFTVSGTQFGTKTVTELATTGWSLTGIVCSEGSHAGSTATFAVDPGDDISCTFTNAKDATVTVTKDAVPNDAQDFGFTTSGSVLAPFSLDDDSDNTLSNTKTFTVPASAFGPKSVTETSTSGWTNTDLECSEGSTSGSTANFTVDAGDAITCTYTNTKHASLTITKDARPNDGQDFAFSTSGTGPVAFTGGFSLDDDANNTLPNSQTFSFSGTQLGAKTVSEAGTAGWALTDITCSEGTTSGSVATLDIDPGDDVTCTFTNKKDATVEITKDAQPNDAQDFTFQTTGAGLSGFSLDDDGDNTLSNSTTFTVSGADFGQKTVTEDAAAGWSLSNLTCSEGTTTGPTATLQVDPGDVITCTYTNDHEATVTIKKDAVPDDPQDFSFTTAGSDLSDFSLDDDNDNTLPDSKTFTVSSFGQKTITEDTTDGWSLTGLECSEGTTSGAKATLDVDPGDAITCTYTNEKDATVTVTKDAVPDDPQDFSFTTSGSGLGNFSLDDDNDSTLSNSKTFTVPAADFGQKTITEDGENGWSMTNLECSEGTTDGSLATLDVDAGDEISCTYTNAKDATLTVVKDAVPDDPQDFSFTTSGSGLGNFSLDDDTDAALPSSKTFTIPAADFGTKTVSETATTGWTLSDATCLGDDDSSVSSQTATLDVDAGESITCTFENSKHGSIAVVKTEAGHATSGQFEFTLTGGPDNVNVPLTTNTNGNTDTLAFGVYKPGTYTMCESVPTGYGSSLGPDSSGDACETFTLAYNEAKVFNIDNTPCPAGTVTIAASMPEGMLDEGETQTFDYVVTGPNNFHAETSITFHAGEFSLTKDITVPIAGSYTVTPLDSPPFGPQEPVTQTVAPPGCTATAAMAAPAFAPPLARGIKTTVPAGAQAGWTFTLKKSGVQIEQLATNALGEANFVTGLAQGNYTIVETSKLGWTQTASSGCSFTVNLPADAGRVFTCSITNSAFGGISVVKTEQRSGSKPRRARGHWQFTLDGGPAGAGHVHLSFKTNEGGFANSINFGRSLPSGVYTICETRFGSWRSSLLGKTGGYKDASGNACMRFTLAAGQVKKIKVNNLCTAHTAAARKLPT